MSLVCARQQENYTMKLVVVQLSDIHFKAQSDRVLGRADQIVNAARSIDPACEAYLLAYSGDIAYSGKPDEYSVASKFLNEIHDGLVSQTVAQRVWEASLPGNHDCLL